MFGGSGGSGSRSGKEKATDDAKSQGTITGEFQGRRSNEGHSNDKLNVNSFDGVKKRKMIAYKGDELPYEAAAFFKVPPSLVIK